jgi:ABC-2 type transport system permease protein
MSGLRQGWLVAVREMRERSRSRAFRASLLLMVLVVAGVIVLPAMLKTDGGTKDVGVTGSIPAELPRAIQAQSDAVSTETRVHRYDTVAAGEEAVRDGDIDVLVVDARRLEWPHQADEQVRAVVTGAIQLVAVRKRAAAAGISPDALLALAAPVPVNNVELGKVAGRGPDDETATFIMTVLLFMAISTYGSMVMSGVVEEKASRVVEVLLARMPARNLLAGKIAGIGLLGLAQIGLTALVALVAVTTVRTFDVPAVRGAVLAWIVVWFVLGYALYATVFGALGSLASRTEDTQSVAGPVTVVLIASYLVSFAAIGSPDSGWARLVSFFPATAPLAMPNRFAMGATAWWEPVVAAALTLAAIAGLVQLGGRVYTRAILHSGPTLKLRDAWRGTSTPGPSVAETSTRHTGTWLRKARATAGGKPTMTRTGETTARWTNVALIGIGAGLGVAVGVLLGDVIIGLAAGAGFYAVATRIVKAWTGPSDRHASHP